MMTQARLCLVQRSHLGPAVEMHPRLQLRQASHCRAISNRIFSFFGVKDEDLERGLLTPTLTPSLGGMM